MKNVSQKIKHICIVTEYYPTKNSPRFTFVDQLVCEMADKGIKCTVINPVSVTRKILRGNELPPVSRIKYTKNNNKIEIRCPRFISMSTRKILSVNTSELTLRNYMNAVESELKKIKEPIDLLYGHFIFPSGITSVELGKKYGIPSFFAYGENTDYGLEYLGYEKTAELVKGVSGVVSVSSVNKEKLIKYSIVEADKIKVFPNGIDNTIFYPHDKSLMRRKLGFPQEAFIIAFTGGFIEIKGADRLSKAIESLNDEEIKSIYIGQGSIKPYGSNIIFENKLPHDKIPEYLSAADIFVLPTLAEGCCNSIIEAMACGLPIISSNRDFNKDLLADSHSIAVDPQNINEIAEAIKLLKNNANLRENMSKNSLKKAENFKLTKRAEGILEFLDEKIKLNSENKLGV